MTRTAFPSALVRLAVIASLFLATLGVAPGVQAGPPGSVSVQKFDQCSNDTGDGYASGDTGCRWINGNLNRSNSRWSEGDSTVQRIWLDNLTPGTQYTISIGYSTTQGNQGKHSYDFLTSWDASESWIGEADRCQDITGCTSAAESTAAMQADPNANGIDTTFGTRVFTMRGATIDVVGVPAIDSGSYAGSSDTYLDLTFTVASSGSLCRVGGTCDVVLWFGAHVARQADWGIGTGAASISGSPFHVMFEGRDNQMSADSILIAPPPGSGNLVLAPQVTGGPAGYTGPFTIQYTCTTTPVTTGSREITAGSAATIAISDGSTCTVTGITPSAPAGYTFGTTTYSPGTQVPITSGTSTTVTITYVLSPVVTPPPVPTPAPVAGLSVTKTAGLSADGPWESSIETDAGTPVWYRIVVTNSGGVALTGITVADSMTDDATPPDCPAIPASLATGASWTCTYSIEAPDGASTNTVTADSDQTAAATASAEVLAAEVLPATDRTGQLPVNPIERYAPLGLGLAFAALLVILSVGLPERRRR